MTPRDLLAAIVAATALGLAFIAIKLGVREAPPLMLTALRFVFAAFPALLFVEAAARAAPAGDPLRAVHRRRPVRPAVPRDRPGHAGRARLAGHPAQAFVTVLLAWIVLGERPSLAQAIGAGIALLGILAIGAGRLRGRASARS